MTINPKRSFRFRLSLLAGVLISTATVVGAVTAYTVQSRTADNYQPPRVVASLKHTVVGVLPNSMIAALQTMIVHIQSTNSPSSQVTSIASLAPAVGPSHSDGGEYVNGASTKYLRPAPVSTYNGPSIPTSPTTCPYNEVQVGYVCMQPYLAP